MQAMLTLLSVFAARRFFRAVRPEPIRRSSEALRNVELDYFGHGNLLRPGSRIVMIFKIPRPHDDLRKRFG